ncbi:MAG TPA: peptidase M4, partial [Shewanella frigidimarina]|nr:peptidase M4 [Shewanella frigidimarina]
QSANVNGHPGYRIKLLTNDGVIFYVLVDATNGSVKRN